MPPTGDGKQGGSTGGSQDDPKKTGGQGPSDQPPTGDKKTDSDPGDGSDLGFTDKQLAYVKGLRKEAADYRTKAKDLESKHSTLEGRFSKLEGGLKKIFGEDDDKLTPEQKLEQVQAQNEALQFQNAITQAALENGVTGEDVEYFSYLVSKEAEALGENEELSAEKVAEIAKKAKGRVAPGNSNTSVGGNTDGKDSKTQDPPPPSNGGDGEVTLDQFCAMSIGQKSELYQKNKDLYQSLLSQARKDGKLI